MIRYLLPVLFLIIVCVGMSCKKSPDQPPPPIVTCLAPGMASNDPNMVKNIVTNYINSLSSQQYTSENLDKLGQVISAGCTVEAKILCFNCIKTLPSMTELIISFPNSTPQKAVDISYTASNEMKVVNVH